MCERLINLTGCNSCEFPVESTRLMTTLRSEAVARVCLYLSQSELIENKFIDPENIRVKCSGMVSFGKFTPGIEDKDNIFRQNVVIIGAITTRWYECNPKQKGSIEGCIIRGVADNIQTLSNIYALRQYFVLLVKNLRKLTICNEMCDEITIHKTVSNCKFKLGSCVDMPKITDPIVMLNALRTGITAHASLLPRSMCIDLSAIAISCDGTTTIPSTFIYIKDPEPYIKNKCIQILEFWIGRHHYHPEALTILDVKRACVKAKNCRGLMVALRDGIAEVEAGIFFRD